MPAPPRVVQRQAPALIWPGSHLGGLIQCTLTTGQVTKVVTYINKNLGTLGTLTFDDATPSEQQLEENYSVIGKGIRAEDRAVSDEHVGQVAKSLGVKAKKSLSWRNPVQQEVVEEQVIPHLEQFPKDAEEKLKSHDPQKVSLLAQVDGKKIASVQVKQDVQTDITTPDNSQEVTTTTGDGEVTPLIAALSDFAGYLEDKKNQSGQHHFTVALVGPYGPCNGCKKRLARFVALWTQKAAASMKTGVIANLTITYKYAKKPQKQRLQYYGYPEDDIQSGPYLHTLLSQATGTNTES